jgi:Na+-transporting NADH:ubiquinone oxidoreductase subunit NqrB
LSRTNFDWRWIIVIILALLFFGQISLAPSAEVSIVLLALGGYWALQAGLAPWRGRDALLGGPKVTYWRGQRIELPRSQRARFRAPAATSLIVSIVYLIMSAGCWLGALRLIVLLVASLRPA